MIVHIRMLDKSAQLQQEAVGVLGINLIHAAFYKGGDSAAIIGSLLSELSRARIEVRPQPPPNFRTFDRQDYYLSMLSVQYIIVGLL